MIRTLVKMIDGRDAEFAPVLAQNRAAMHVLTEYVGGQAKSFIISDDATSDTSRACMLKELSYLFDNHSCVKEKD